MISKGELKWTRQLNYRDAKREISEVLEQQIAFHYGLAEGEAEVTLPRDKTVGKR